MRKKVLEVYRSSERQVISRPILKGALKPANSYTAKTQYLDRLGAMNKRSSPTSALGKKIGACEVQAASLVLGISRWYISCRLFSTTLRPPTVGRNLDNPNSSCNLVSYIHTVKLPDARVC